MLEYIIEVIYQQNQIVYEYLVYFAAKALMWCRVVFHTRYEN